MRISDISLDDIRQGKNWKLLDPDEFLGSLPMEEMSIEPLERFGPEDYVVYSAIYVTDAGEVLPHVMIKEVGSLEYGGDVHSLMASGGKQDLCRIRIILPGASTLPIRSIRTRPLIIMRRMKPK